MPLASAGVGFGVTFCLLIALWALMCYTALLLLEVYQHVPADMGLGSLAARYLGRYGQWVTGFCMLFLMYALTAAYISGAGELLASSLNQWLDWQLPPAAGVLVTAGSLHAKAWNNRAFRPLHQRVGCFLEPLSEMPSEIPPQPKTAMTQG